MTKKSQAILVDLDGTLCNIDHRIKYITSNPKQRDKFHSLIHKDTVNKWCNSIIEQFYLKHKIILCTGRSDKYREKTEKWLNDNDIIFHRLIMRKDKDFRPDAVVKKELYYKYIAPKYEILFILEDRLTVCRMWYKIGLTVLKCGDPDLEF